MSLILPFEKQRYQLSAPEPVLLSNENLGIGETEVLAVCDNDDFCGGSMLQWKESWSQDSDPRSVTGQPCDLENSLS